VEAPRFHVTEYRGFEGSARGRPVSPRMAAINRPHLRICPGEPPSRCSENRLIGIPSVTIPPTAVKLRRLLNLAQIQFSRMRCRSFISAASRFPAWGWERPAKRKSNLPA